MDHVASGDHAKGRDDHGDGHHGEGHVLGHEDLTAGQAVHVGERGQRGHRGTFAFLASLPAS